MATISNSPMTKAKFNAVGLGTLQFPRNPDFSSSYAELESILLRVGAEAVKHNLVIPLDLARAYGNEEHIGQFFRNHPKYRNSFELITKIGIDFGSENPYVTDADELRKHIADSFERLGPIETVMLHRICHEWDPSNPVDQAKIDATYKVLVEFKAEKKCVHIGVSECNSQMLRYLADTHGVDVFEFAWSPFIHRGNKNGIVDVIKEFNIRTFTYSSVLRGFFNDKIFEINTANYATDEELRQKVLTDLGITENPFENTVGFYDSAYIRQNVETVQEFNRLATQHGLTPAELSIGCAIHMGFVPIPGSSNIDRILQNTFDIKEIDPDVIKTAMSIAIKFAGNPNPSCLSKLDDPTL